MDTKNNRALLDAHSRVEISRRDISQRLDTQVTFGDVLATLHRDQLPLPRFPDLLRVKLIERPAERASRVGSSCPTQPR